MQKYSITFSKHSDSYNFYDPREIIPEFLQVFENSFIQRKHLQRVRVKCNFTIINLQPPPLNDFVELTDARVWVTDVYEGVYFNEYIKSAIFKDIRKIIIVNGMTGSS